MAGVLLERRKNAKLGYVGKKVSFERQDLAMESGKRKPVCPLDSRPNGGLPRLGSTSYQ